VDTVYSRNHRASTGDSNGTVISDDGYHQLSNRLHQLDPNRQKDNNLLEYTNSESTPIQMGVTWEKALAGTKWPVTRERSVILMPLISKK